MRARNIKPGFFINPQIGALRDSTQLVFIGLWCVADRAGRCEECVQRLAVQIRPYAQSFDMLAALDELEKAGFIVRYSVKGVKYLEVLNFLKHQHPHINEKESTIPACAKHGAATRKAPKHSGGNPSDSLIPDSLIPDSLIPDIRTVVRERYPKRLGGQRWQDAERAINARLEEGSTREDLLSGVDRYSAYLRATGRLGTEYVMQAATFFGRNRGFEEPWTIPTDPAKIVGGGLDPGAEW